MNHVECLVCLLGRQFTAKHLEKLAKKAEKDSEKEQAKVKKVRRWKLDSLILDRAVKSRVSQLKTFDCCY